MKVYAKELFSSEHTVIKELFEEDLTLFEAITKIKEFSTAGPQALKKEYTEISPEVFAARDAKIPIRKSIRSLRLSRLKNPRPRTHRVQTKTIKKKIINQLKIIKNQKLLNLVQVKRI